jgi:sec-independent protein translocase protein TatA
MFGIGTQEMIIILILVLVIFGAGKLPEVGGALGRSLRSFKDGMKGDGEVDRAREAQQMEDKRDK